MNVMATVTKMERADTEKDSTKLLVLLDRLKPFFQMLIRRSEQGEATLVREEEIEW